MESSDQFICFFCGSLSDEYGCPCSTSITKPVLKNNNQPPEEKSIAVLLAEKSILTVMQTLEEKQNDTESMQELLLQLSKDLQTLNRCFNKNTSDYSPKIDFLLEEFAGELALINSIQPWEGELTRVVVEDIFGEPRVHMPNVLPTHLILCQDMDFTLFTDFSGSDLVISFPSRNRNKTFDPGISIEVQSKIFLSLNKFSISFISDPFSPVLETLLPFSFKIEDNDFNHGILVSKEEKSPHPYLIGALKLSRSFIISLMKAR
ncbi:hypothetical protein Tco_0468013 [Tanacetum coccineum]